MATTSLRLTHERASDYRGSSTDPSRLVAAKFTDLLAGCAAGVRAGATGLEVAQTCATGTVTLATASGTVGATINGVSVTTAFDTDDATTATALAEAINDSADALVSNHVTASAAAGVVTVTAKHPGHPGNAVTLAATGTGATASGARLTGGTSTTYTF